MGHATRITVHWRLYWSSSDFLETTTKRYPISRRNSTTAPVLVGCCPLAVDVVGPKRQDQEGLGISWETFP